MKTTKHRVTFTMTRADRSKPWSLSVSGSSTRGTAQATSKGRLDHLKYKGLLDLAEVVISSAESLFPENQKQEGGPQ